ncbi:MarR family winged helix-turn-helix transcriptional regulator [Pseudovibrio flavus]|uniref:MarR family winged helix-turn-helix transcriptional regulator n=1 Tax=Pseudovibrio flavus TaxID=2529854 RepID=UPI0012BD4A80
MNRRTSIKGAVHNPEQVLVTADNPSRLIRRALILSNKIHGEIFKSEDITPVQLAALSVLEEQGPCTKQVLGLGIDMELGNVNGLVKRLAERELVREEIDPLDRRNRVVSLTGKGLALAVRLLPLARKVEEAFLAPLSEPERVEFRSLLAKLGSGST